MLITKELSLTESDLKNIIGKYIEKEVGELVGEYNNLIVKMANGTTCEEVVFTTIKFTWNENK